MGVQVRGQRDLRVTQELHDLPQRQALSEQQGCRSVAQVVESLAPQSGMREESVESVRDVRSVERPSDRRAEHKAMVLPQRSRLQPLLPLAHPVLLECCPSNRRQIESAPAARGLGLG